MSFPISPSTRNILTITGHTSSGRMTQSSNRPSNNDETKTGRSLPSHLRSLSQKFPLIIHTPGLQPTLLLSLHRMLALAHAHIQDTLARSRTSLAYSDLDLNHQPRRRYLAKDNPKSTHPIHLYIFPPRSLFLLASGSSVVNCFSIVFAFFRSR